MTPAERAAAVAGFLDATAPGWAAAVDAEAEPFAYLATALEPHARRVGLDVATYAKAHGWLAREPPGPFTVAWRAELARRAGAALRCAYCGAAMSRHVWHVRPGGPPPRCPTCTELARHQTA